MAQSVWRFAHARSSFMSVPTRALARWLAVLPLLPLLTVPEWLAQAPAPPSGYVHLPDSATPINPAHALMSRYIHAQGASAFDDLFRKLQALKPDAESLETFVKENKDALRVLAQLIREKKIDIDEN